MITTHKSSVKVHYAALLIGDDQNKVLLTRLGYFVIFADTADVALQYLRGCAKGIDGSAVGIDVVIIGSAIPDQQSLWAKLGEFPEAWEAICFMLGDGSSGGHIELPIWQDQRGADEKILASLCFASRLIGA